MSLFNTLLEIKTGKQDLLLKAIYNPLRETGSNSHYQIYYYDSIKHTFYINHIESKNMAKTTQEAIINKIYAIEMNTCIDIMKRIRTQSTQGILCIDARYKGYPAN